MKKQTKVLAAALMLSVAMAASAADVSVGVVNDFTAKQAGERVSIATDAMGNFKLTGSATHINKTYNRYAIGGEYALLQNGPVVVSATGAATWQQNLYGPHDHGYGLTAGVRADWLVAKNVSLYAGYERFIGQHRINSFNGNLISVGAKVTF